MVKCRHIVILFLSILLIIGMILLSLYYHYPIKYKDIIEENCIKYNVDYSLIFAIVKAESNFNSMAVSSKGAIGLMQIMPSTAKYIEGDTGDINLYVPHKNISIGVKYIRYLMYKFNGDYIAVIAAYNAGEGVVMKWILSKQAKYNDKLHKLSVDYIEYDETKKYVLNVQKYQHYYEILYNLE